MKYLLLDRVRIQCKSKKVPISKMERELKFPRGYISKWNKIIPGVDKVKKVADYLNIKIECLLNENED